MEKKHYIVVDIETTGLSRDKHRITEIGAVMYDGSQITNEFHTLINPECKIPSFITHLTGINNDMVKYSPKICEALPLFIDFIQDNILVAHNATFDYNFLAHNSSTYIDHNITNPTLCTRRLANRLVNDLHSKRLEVLCQHFNVENKGVHRALTDAYATTEVLAKFLDMLQDFDINKKEDILNFQFQKIGDIQKLLIS